MNPTNLPEKMLRTAHADLRKLREASMHFDELYTRRCVITVVLLKYIDDYLESRCHYYEQQHTNQPYLISRKMERERFVLPPGKKFSSLLQEVNAYPLTIGNILNEFSSTIELANEQMLGGLLRTVDFNNAMRAGASEADWRTFLANLVTAVSRMTLVSDWKDMELKRDWLLETISLLWPLQFSVSGSEQYYAPPNLCRLLIALMAPKSGSRIYDPACKTGFLLRAAAAAVTDDNNKPSGNYALYGQETQPEAVFLARVHMLIHELDGAKITMDDPIKDPVLTGGKELLSFDILVSNLPWNIQGWGYDDAANDKYGRFKWGIAPEMKGDWAYIQHMISTAAPTGRIGVIVPTGLLFREGREQQIRQAVIDNNLLDAVILLPSNLFYLTKLPCAIIVLDKNRGQKKKVLFIDAGKEYEADKRQNKLREQDINHVLSTYTRFKNSSNSNDNGQEMSYSTVASTNEIAAHQYNFSPPRYIQTAAGSISNLSSDELEVEIEELKKKLEDVRKNIRLNFRQLDI